MQTSIEAFADGVSVLSLSGDLDAEGAGRLREAIDRQTAEGRCRLVVDCSAVGFSSSAGIGAMIRVQRNVKEQGGRVVFAGTDGPVFEVLRLMNLGTILELYADTDQALSALRQTSDQTPDGANG